MKNALKKAISVLLVAVMVFGAAPLAGFVGFELPELNLLNVKAEAADEECTHPEDKLTWETYIAPTCKPGIDFAICGVCGTRGISEIVCDSSTYPESSHNYINNTNLTWDFSYEGANKLILKFSSSTKTESNYDYIYIYNASGAQVGKYSGTQLSGKELELEGSSFKIKLTSDSSAVYYGFKFDSITAKVSDNEDPSLTRETAATGIHAIPSSGGTCSVCGIISGTCGENLTWTLDKSTGELVISGTGAMTDWSYSSKAPWYSYRLTIKSVTIADGVTSIGDYAFYYCNLASITIPDSVTSIGDSVFDGCKKLAGINVDSANTVYSSDEYGVMFNKNKTELLLYPMGNTRTSYTIPDSVTSIGHSAFEDSSSLTSITISDSVTTIDDWAFNSCTSLANITIPGGVTSISTNAFSYCTKLTSINVDSANTVYSSDEYGVMFNKDKTELLRYPIGNTRTSYTIPDSVTSIGYPAFKDCSNLTSITIPESVTKISSYAFGNCSSLASITIPDGVTSIGYSAFKDCSSLASITIPDGVTTIDEWTFYGCTSLASITIPESVTSIGSYAFCSCTSLESITIPDSVTSISYSAFEGCSRLTSITIPDGVTKIGSSTFENCTSLASITIPDSVTSIGDNTFYLCNKLADVCYSGTKEQSNNIIVGEDNECLLNAVWRYVITGECGDNLVWSLDYESGELTVSGTGEMIDLTDPSSAPWYGKCSLIKSVTIADGVTSIGDYAFNGYDALESVTIGNGVTSIGDNAFGSCSNISTVNYSVTVAQWNDFSVGSSNDNLVQKIVFKDNPDLTCLNWGTCGSDLRWKLYSNGELIISGTGAMTNWTSSSSAPWDSYLSSIKSVTIPDGVTRIGNYAFYDFYNLTTTYYEGTSEQWKEISIGNGNDYLTKNIIYECNSERPYRASGVCGENLSWKLYADGELVISGTGAMTDWSYYSSVPWYSKGSLIKSVTVSDDVTSIDSYAFYGCNNLASIKIGNGVTRIGESAFVGTALYSDSSNWEDDVLYIGNCLIKARSTVSGEYHIKDGTKVIADDAFYNCSGLTAVTIPDSVTRIGDYAFYSYNNRTTPYYEGTPEQWKEISIGNGNNFLTNNIIYEYNSERPYYDGGACGENLSWKLYADGELKISGAGAMTDWTSSAKAPWYSKGSLIKSVTVSDSVTSIGDYAFYGCNNLASIKIGNGVTQIGESAFVGTALYSDSSNWENDVLYIGNCLIKAGSTVCGEYQIKDGTKVIADKAFYNCSELTAVTIPDSVTGIGDYAFYGCDKLSNAYYTGSPEQWGAVAVGLNNNSSLNNIIFDADSDRPYHAGTCGENLVWKIYVDSTELEISGTGAMMNWSYSSKAPWYKYSSQIESVKIQDGVTTIGKYAFYACDLESVTIPDSVTGMGNDAFYCTSLTNVYYTGSLAEWCAIEFESMNANPMYYADNIYIDGDLINGNFVIPKEITSIGAYAFVGYSDLVTVTLHSGITSIGKSAFDGCGDLYKVNYPGTLEQWQNIPGSSDNKDLEEILVFECNSLNPYYGGTCGENLRWKMYVKGTELFISGTGPMEDYGYYAVSSVTTAPWRKQSSRIKTVTISDGVTSVGACAFLNCKSLKNANLPDSIETIEGYAFAGCNILSKIKLPDSLTYIGDYAFWYCYPLSKVEIPDGVTKIDEGAFKGCSFIVSVTIPKSVTSICEDAFAECSNIIGVYYAGSKADWEKIIIYSGNETLTSAAILYNHNGGSGGGSTSDPDNTPDYDSSVTDKLLVATPSQTTVSYGDSIVLHMDSSKIPEGGKVEWYPSNKNFSHSVSSDGTTCTITPNKSGDTTFTAVVYDAEGNIVSADEQKMTSKAGFFDKLIAFFKKLFGATKVIPQAFRNIY